MTRTSTNLVALRDRFAEILGNRKTSFTSSQIPPLLERLGLSDCPDAPSKRDQLRGAVHASTDDQIVMAAYRALEMLPLPVHERDVRIPRHLDTQPALIWTLVPRALGHLIHVHLDRQSERSDAGLH
ncbi:hypothetical protein ACIUYA_33935, partial [Pseudomonas aeruginosa]